MKFQGLVLDKPLLTACIRFSAVVSKTKTEARSTQISKAKHPDLENETPRTRKRSTQNSKTKQPKLESEAPKSRNHCWLKDYNFKSCMTQAKPGGGNGSVRTSKSPPIHSTEHYFNFSPAEVGQFYWLSPSFLPPFCLRKPLLEHFASTYVDHWSYQ